MLFFLNGNSYTLFPSFSNMKMFCEPYVTQSYVNFQYRNIDQLYQLFPKKIFLINKSLFVKLNNCKQKRKMREDENKTRFSMRPPSIHQ